MNNYPLVAVELEARMVEVTIPRYRLMNGIGTRPAAVLTIDQAIDNDINADRAIKGIHAMVYDEREIRTAKEYNELRQLQAVANTRAAKSLKVSTKVHVSSSHETILCACEKTGITVELIAPKIPGFVLSYANPLALYKNASGIIAKGTEYMNKLDSQVLAGLFITAYSHYDLISVPSELTGSGVAMNAMLRTAGKQILVDSLDLFTHIHSGNKHKLPMFSLDYNAHKEFTSVGPALQEYNKAIRNIIYPGAESAYKKSSEAAELAKIEEQKYRDDISYASKEPSVEKIKGRTKLTTAAQLYEEQFILNRREAKVIIARLTEARTVPVMFLLKLKPVFIGKNLVAMADNTRASVAAKLRSYKSEDAHRLAKIVEEGHNPYDIFADIDDAFSTNESNLSNINAKANKPKLSLAQILEAKKNGTYEQLLAQAEASSEAVEEVEPVEAVKFTYTAEDEARHLEIEEALDDGCIVSAEDAEWNSKYLAAKDAQELVESNDADYEEGDSNGSDF